MKNILFAVLLILIFLSQAVAYERHQFELSLPDAYEVEEYKDDLKNWVSSLIKGVGYSPEEVLVTIFLKTNVSIVVDGKLISGVVYQNKDNPSQFYVTKPKGAIVDFSSNLVGTMGVAGISSHPTPSGRMVVVLAPDRNTNILGVTLDFTSKVEVREPAFKGKSVSYEW